MKRLLTGKKLNASKWSSVHSNESLLGKGTRGGTYYYSYFDHDGKKRTKSARTTDKATAERIVAKLEAGAALRRRTGD